MSKALATATPYPFLMNDTFISIILTDGENFTLDDSHPTFGELRTALSKKNWKKVPHLVTVAAKIANKSQGNVTVTAQGVYYKGRKIDSSLTKRIITLLKENQDVSYMLKFMDNLYANPVESAINELFDFLGKCNLPITDDGCFMAYKMVNQNYTDCHSGKFDNSPGQIIVMPRKDVDPDRRNECSRGFHFCSKEYLGSGFGGGRLMRVKVDPKDVVSIPMGYGYSKGRTWKYEVVDEISDKRSEWSSGDKDHVSMLTSVVPVAKIRKDLLANILTHKTVQRAITRRQVKLASLRKWSYGQLVKFWNKLPHDVAPATQSKLFQNTLKVYREQFGIGLKEVAEEMDLSYKAIWAAERSTNLRQSTVDRYIEAVNSIVAERKREADNN